jgi:hypothetical protein
VQCYLHKPLVEAALIDCLRIAVAHGQACRAVQAYRPIDESN